MNLIWKIQIFMQEATQDIKLVNVFWYSGRWQTHFLSFLVLHSTPGPFCRRCCPRPAKKHDKLDCGRLPAPLYSTTSSLLTLHMFFKMHEVRMGMELFYKPSPYYYILSVSYNYFQLLINNDFNYFFNGVKLSVLGNAGSATMLKDKSLTYPVDNFERSFESFKDSRYCLSRRTTSYF